MLTTDFETIKQRFVDQWTNTVTTLYDNAPNQTLDPTLPYVRFSVIAGASEHAGGNAATGLKRQLGRIWLDIYIPRQQGEKAALDLIDEFAPIFRNWRSDDAALHCKTEEISRRDEEPYYRVKVQFEWESLRSYQP